MPDYDTQRYRKIIQYDADGNVIDVANPLPVSLSSDIEIGAVEIKDGTTDERANVDWDGFYSALATTDGRMVFSVDDNSIATSLIPQTCLVQNYGYEDTEGVWTRLLTEYDNDDVPGGQRPQLVLPLNYYWEAKSGAWKRWQGDSGSMWTTIYGMYSITGDSLIDDDADAIKVIGQETPTDDYTTPTKAIVNLSTNMVYDGTTWDMQRGDSTNGTLVNLGSNNDVTVTGTVTVDNMIPAVETGLATSALQLPDGHNVTVDNGTGASAVNIQDGGNTITVDGAVTVTGTVTANAGTNLNTSALALETSQGQWRSATSGLSNWKEADGKPRISQQPYLYDIAEENMAGHKAFYKLGFNPVITNTEETVWPYGGKYAFIKGESTLEVVSTDNTQDIGSILFNSTSTGGSTTTLIDTGVDFTAGANPVAVYDCVILDKSGATPEWGYVTAVTATTLTIARGFSQGGTGDSRDYIVLNRTAYTGCQAVYIGYLDVDFVQHTEIVILNGTTSVSTINIDYYRINDMIVIAAGTLEAPLGNILLRDLADTPVYSQITATYTRARSGIFTVPYGKVLYITSWGGSWATPNDSKVQSFRMTLRTNREPQLGFFTDLIFYPVAETMVTNEHFVTEFDVPLKFQAGTDVIVAGISMNAAGSGPATTVLRGWDENA